MGEAVRFFVLSLKTTASLPAPATMTPEAGLAVKWSTHLRRLAKDSTSPDGDTKLELTVVAARDETLIVGMKRGAKDDPIMGGDAACLALARGDKHCAVAQGKHGLFADPMNAGRTRSEGKAAAALVYLRTHGADRPPPPPCGEGVGG